MALKERIKKALEHSGVDIPALASAAGVKTPSVHGWVNGDSKSMRAGPCIKAAAHMKVNPLWLAEGEGDMLGPVSYDIAPAPILMLRDSSEPAYTSPLRDLIDIAAKMSRDGQLILLGRAEELVKQYPLNRKQRSS